MSRYRAMIDRHVIFHFRDRIRTTSNVLSHTHCAAITHHFNRQGPGKTEEPEMIEEEVELIVHSPDAYNS